RYFPLRFPFGAPLPAATAWSGAKRPHSCEPLPPRIWVLRARSLLLPSCARLRRHASHVGFLMPHPDSKTQLEALRQQQIELGRKIKEAEAEARRKEREKD